MLLIVSLAGVLIAQAAAPAAAAPPVPTVAPVSAGKPVASKKPKKVCTDTAPIGSIISKRVCKTAEETEADVRNARTITDTFHTVPNGCSGNC